MDMAYCSDIPVYTVKRKYFEDSSLADREGLLIDLHKMNRIRNIDPRNLIANIEMGVTFEQLQKELDKVGLRVLFSAAAGSESVLRSYLDRDILLGSVCYRQPNLSIFHAITADGRLWKSGSQQITDEGHADFREDQGPQFSPLFGASEDIFGVPFYGIIYVYPKREYRRVLAFSFPKLEPAMELLYRISRKDQCFECFAGNRRFLSVLSTNSAKEADSLAAELPPWTVVISLEHYRELVELWEEYITQDARGLSGDRLDADLTTRLASQLENSWYFHDRDKYRGRCLPITFYHYCRKVPGMFHPLQERAAEDNLSPDDLGQLVVPVYFGGAAYCEVDLYLEADQAEPVGHRLVSDSYDTLLDMGALVDKPLGDVAEKVFSRVNPTYIEMIKRFKSIMDPKCILNSDQFLEGI